MEEHNETQATVTEEKQPRFINDSPFTLETMRKAYKQSKIIYIVGFILCGLSLYEYWYWWGNSVFLICALIYATVGAIYYSVYRLNTTRNTQVADNAHHVYSFYEDEICGVLLHGEEKRGEQRIAYTQVTKVINLGDYIMIQFGGLGWLLDPSCFTIGSTEEMLDFLREKCSAKVVKIKNKK